MFGILLWLTFPLQTNLDEAPALQVPGANASGAAIAQKSQDRIPKLLERWETNSRQQEERSTSSRQSLLLNVTQQLNGHAAVAVVQLLDQVRASQLADLFSWSIAEEKEGLVCLEARPKDETERLFFDSIRVWLDSESCQLIKLQTTDRQGHLHTNWLSGILPPNRVEVKFANVPSAEQSENAIALASAVATSGANVATLKDSNSGSDESSPDALELAEILKKWEAASQATKTARIRFSRTVYNLVFEVEIRAEGELAYEASDNLRMTINAPKATGEGTPRLKAEVSNRMNKNGIPFKVEEDDRPNTWIITPKDVLFANDVDKTFRREERPEVEPELVPGWLLLYSLPGMPRHMKWTFGLDVRADRILKEWDLKLVKRRNNNTEIIISAKPRQLGGQWQSQECWVMIDCERWQSKAIKFYELSGNLEIIYRFNDRTLNQPLPKEIFDLDVERQGYKELQQRVAPK